MDASPALGAGVIGLLVVLAVAAAQGEPTTHVVIVTGVSGEPAYAAAFERQARTLMEALERQHSVPRTQITWLAEDPSRDPRIAARSTRDGVARELARLAGVARSGDRVLVVLIGHGSDQGEPRFNLPGPDLTAHEWAQLLDNLATSFVAVVVAASASGGFVDRLTAPTRLVMTATRSGFERNETRFGEWFVRAFAGGAADTDKDGALSLYEAFQFAVAEVRREYDQGNRLLTEHARVSDSALAARFVFGAARLPIAPADSVLAALLARKQDLERRIAELRSRRATMEPTVYERELEDLLVELARTNQAIRQRESRGEGGGGGPP
jgi:hypothetical protein